MELATLPARMGGFDRFLLQATEVPPCAGCCCLSSLLQAAWVSDQRVRPRHRRLAGGGLASAYDSGSIAVSTDQATRRQRYVSDRSSYPWQVTSVTHDRS